jgi:hypothetical protein
MGTTKKAKAPLREQKGLSGVITSAITESIMPKKPRSYQVAVHKNIARDRFIKSCNPAVGVKLRAIIEELKRKENGHE